MGEQLVLVERQFCQSLHTVGLFLNKIMSKLTYETFPVNVISHRFNALRGQDAIIDPKYVISLILRHAVNMPIYKTKLTDPINAYVELLCKIIPDRSIIRDAPLPSRHLDERQLMAVIETGYFMGIFQMYGLYGTNRDVQQANQSFELAARKGYT